MFAFKKLIHAPSHLPLLAATAFICCSLNSNTQVDAANTLSDIRATVPAHEAVTNVTPSSAKDTAKNMQVLSPKDADLYRAAFKAQTQNDWNSADAALAVVSDHRLIGHVLADRYLRRTASEVELREWLEAYSDLPEASDLYDQTKHLKLSKNEPKFKRPALTDAWGGNGLSSGSIGFKNENGEPHRTPLAHNFSNKIDRVLRSQNPFAAKATLEAEQKTRVIPPVELASIKSQIAADFFYEGQSGFARSLTNEIAAAPTPQSLWIGGLAAYRENDMADAAKSFTKLAALSNLSSWDKAATEFWAYRSYKRLGNKEAAHYWLEEAAKQPRSFYGLLAVQLAGQDAVWSWQLPQLNAQNIELLSRHPAGARALALLQIGQTDLAESELRNLNPGGQKDIQEAMLAVAEKAHMPSLALQLGSIATNESGKHYDAALYPLPPWQPAQGFNVDRALLYALMRHESQFDPTAVSDRGACGLMQLMPATANLIADDNLNSRHCSERLLDPSYNLALGQKYVRRLADQPLIGNNLLLLLTAYNSGPGKLERWMDDEARHDPLMFVESLPVHETRSYVQQVLIQYWTYRSRLSEPQTSLAQLARGEWPRTGLRDETAVPPLPSSKEAHNIESYKVASSQR